MTAESFGPVILVHGGAGKTTPDLVDVRRAGVRQAALAGWELLSVGCSALDAVERSVRVLEDDPVFNAGLGACLNRDGKVELDASIMDGRDLAAGAIGAVQRIANPVSLARKILEKREHILLVSEGAERIAAEVGIPECDPDALITERQRARWVALREANVGGVGTVGAVTRDRAGHLAAATSTGGLPLKVPGRVGDSALIGCGTYADDSLGAASCTGDGEAIIKLVLAKTALELLRIIEDPMDAARRAVDLLARRTGADVGIILLDPRGRIGFAKNTAQMPCAYIRGDDSGVGVVD